MLQRCSMGGVYKYEDLWVWRLSAQLRDEIFALTERGQASRDFKFRDQSRDSSSSAPRNISEGFALYKPRLFAKHLRVALGSLAETKNHLEDGGTKKNYFSPEDTGRLIRLTHRAITAGKRLLRYLDSRKAFLPPTGPTIRD